MALPLLALPSRSVGASATPDTVTFVLQFRQSSLRRVGPLGFMGPTLQLTIVDNLDAMPTRLRPVVEQLRQLICAGIVGDGRVLPNGGREWSMTQAEFVKSMANHVCTIVFPRGGAGSSGSSVPPKNTLVEFRQSLLDDGGQMMLFKFALE